VEIMSGTILVTGASGNVGRETVKALVDGGYRVKAGTRNVAKIPTAENVHAVTFDYTDPRTHNEALADATGIVLVAPPMDAQAPDKLIPLIERAGTTGIDHIVFNSALGVDRNEQAPLRIVERAVMESGIPYTILRPNFFMDNFSTGFIGPMITQQDGIFVAAGEAKTSFIAARDIAAVAAAAFANKLTGREYNLTGPEALDRTAVARIISDVTGREITYHALPEEVMLQGARDQGLPEAVVQYMATLYGAVRAGYTAIVTDDVETVTGQKPETFSLFAKRNATCWE
jgi:uncharacterized protein YbjT (DUF2867 family)